MNETGRDWPTIIAGVGLGLILVGMLFVTANYLGILSLSSFPGLGWLPQKTIKQDITQPREGTYPERQLIDVPISLSDPAVEFAKVNYNLTGNIYSIKEAGEGRFELVLRGTGGNIYFDLPFIVTSETAINNAATPELITVSDLKTDDKITLFYSYDLKKVAGTVSSIFVRQ